MRIFTANLAWTTLCASEQGMAVLLALIALSLFSLLGLFMMLNATTDLRISDNLESQTRASCAAMAGLNHSRVLLRGLSFDQHLKGPDGTNDSSMTYLAQVRAFAFRNPIPWAAARSLDIFNPANSLIGISDDGLLNTGHITGTSGIPLIPLSGIAQIGDNPYGPGTLVLSRYFVKVADNNGEATEFAGDPADNPFYDGDGVVIVRSMGVAQTIREKKGSAQINSSVVVYEARFKRRSTFRLPAPLVIQGSRVDASFAGNDFVIDGAGQPGIASIDIDPADGYFPDQILRTAAAGNGSIIGGGLPSPSIADFTGSIGSNTDQALLLDPAYLWNFAHNVAPGFADYVYSGDQHWSTGSAPYIGSFDVMQPESAPGQNPKVTLVNGNLSISGGVVGGGLLIVTGNFSCDGGFKYDGLVLVIGAGGVSVSDLNPGISGGMYVVQVTSASGVTSFGMPTFSMSGQSNIIANASALSMAVGMIPVSQIGFREVTSSIDP